MHDSVYAFGQDQLDNAICAGALVLEVGSLNVNGSLRDHVGKHQPRGYIGIDMQTGPGVDIMCSLQQAWQDIFHPRTFNLIVCTEMLEHTQDPGRDLYRMVQLLAPGGWLFLTTRSVGFPYHAHPVDNWRFSKEALRNAMAILGMRTETCIDDPGAPGVMLLASRWDGGQTERGLYPCARDIMAHPGITAFNGPLS